ncbi:glycosyltransferase [Vicingus serpentipes]|uniref:Glycosyltransferase n=1 Tax=Vicingus serpentipes TaxID=1926625 RepID=A0A5C6RZ38_9FLAO|nr:glycosyltransferase [Vicingus serpentipes]TXB66910.1 glycosyltransferase [Vicingus serpentipes]
MSKKLNILFLASWYPNNLLPFNGNFIQKHAQAVSKFCNVSVLHIIAHNQDEKFKIDTAENNNVYEVIVYYRKINSNSPIHQFQKLKRRQEAHLLGYKTILEKVRHIDITHLNVVFPAGSFALYLKKKFNIPFIISENWTALLENTPTQLGTITKKIVQKTLDNADVLCPVSEDLKQALQKLTANLNYQIVPNVVNTNTFTFKEHSAENKILHISNLKDEHKNITGILDTIKELSKTRNDFFITIAGNGDYHFFNQYALKIGIQENLFKIEGAKSTEEVAQLMQSHNLFLLYSNYENLPCVISEALVTGMPVLTSKAGGTAEMITDENGIVVPPKNNKILLEKLNYMLDNLANYNCKEISKNGINIYSYEAVGKQFLAIYTKLLSK